MNVTIKVITPNGIDLVDFTVVEKYKDGSVLAMSSQGKTKLFGKKQVKNYTK